MKRFSYLYSLFIVAMIIFSGCAPLKGFINKTITASGDTLKTDILEIEQILKSDIVGLSDSLLQFFESDRMNALIDSLVSQATESLIEGINVDSLLKTVDANLDATLAGVLDSLLSESVSKELGLRLKEVLITSGLNPEYLKSLILDDETHNYILNLKNELLGDSTRVQVKLLLDAALALYEEYYDKTIQPDVDSITNSLDKINDNLSKSTNKAAMTIGKIAGWFLGVFMLALSSILGYRIYRTAQHSAQQKKLIVTLASAINDIPDQKTYDELTHKIKETTKLKDLDTLLDESIKPLKEKATKEWQDKDNQVLRLLSKYISERGSALESFSGNKMDELRKEAEALGLKDHLNSVINRYGADKS